MHAEINETIGRVVAQINRDTAMSSNPDAAKGHAQYAGLLNLGERALPVLLRNLKASLSEPSFGGLGVQCIFCALADISGEVPSIPD